MGRPRAGLVVKRVLLLSHIAHVSPNVALLRVAVAVIASEAANTDCATALYDRLAVT